MGEGLKPEPRVWKHRKGDRYRAMFGDWWGNPTDGYRQEWTYLGPLRATLAAAKRDGFRAQQSDDFNIGAVRGGELMASLWMDEIVDGEQDVMAEIVESAGDITRD